MKTYFLLALALLAGPAGLAGTVMTCQTERLMPIPSSWSKSAIGPFGVSINFDDFDKTYDDINFRGVFGAERQFTSSAFIPTHQENVIDANGRPVILFTGGDRVRGEGFIFKLAITSGANAAFSGYLSVSDGAKSQWGGRVLCHSVAN